jgi:hypothetical protein
MKVSEKKVLLDQILWDYNIPINDIDAVLQGRKDRAGHYSQEIIFQKLLESYSWFTIIQLLPPDSIRNLLTSEVINKLRSPSLRHQYEFVRKRLQQIIPPPG